MSKSKFCINFHSLYQNLQQCLLYVFHTNIGKKQNLVVSEANCMVALWKCSHHLQNRLGYGI